MQALHPDLVVMSDSASGIMRLASGKRGAPAIREWAAGMKQALAAMSWPGRRMVVLSPNPTGPDPAECVTAVALPSSCETSVQPWYVWKRIAERNAADLFGATYVDASPWFCYHDRCPVFANGLPMRWDPSHLTTSYSRMLTPLLSQAVLGTTTRERRGHLTDTPNGSVYTPARNDG